MCTEPSLLFGPNSIWKAIANSGYSEPWCSVYQFWWCNFIALVLVSLPILVWGWRSIVFVIRAWHQVYSQKNLTVLFSILAMIEPFRLRKFSALLGAMILITFVSFVGIAISNRPSLLIWSLGIDESQRVYHLSRDGNDYLLGALRQVAYAMLTVWLAASLIGVFTLSPLVSSTLATITGWFGTMWNEFSAERGESTPHQSKEDSAKAADIPETSWRAFQSSRNFETPKINLHANTPDKDEEFDGTGAKMTPKKLKAEIFWLSRDGLHLWLREPPQNAGNETEARTEFKLIWVSANKCYKAQARPRDDKTFELDSNVNYCDLPIPKFELELEKVAYHIQVDI